MIVKAAFLFLFGTLTSGQYFPRWNIAPHQLIHASISKLNGCPTGPELAPLICKFMQTNIGQEFKPQLLDPSTYIAPLVVEKCDTPKLEMEIELPSPIKETKPLVIPEAPILPPMTIPKFPVPIIFEEPAAPLPEPCESTDIKEMPIVIPGAPELPPFTNELPHIDAEAYIPEEPVPEIENTIEYKTVPVPPAPELPAFVMPEIPIRIESVVPMPPAPYVKEEPIPAPIPAYIEQAGYIETIKPVPSAPELPKFVMPELSIKVVKPALPMPAAPCLEGEPSSASIPAYIEPEETEYAKPLASLPAAPELPIYVMPELPKFVMPELRIQVAETALPMPSTPYLEDKAISAPSPAYIEPVATEYVEPLAPLPAAPELPKFVMPELPIQVVEKELPMPAAPYPEDEPISEPIPAYIEPVATQYVEPLAKLPAAPELPKFVMPELRIQVAEPELPMPAAPYLDNEPISAPIPAYIEPVATEYIEPLAPLPAAPELPKFVMPELPIQVVEKELPMPATPYLEDESISEPIPAYIEPVATQYVEPLAKLPAAPELPKFVIPEFRIQVVEQELPMPAAPCLDDEPIPAPVSSFFEPVAPLPAAPELPKFVMPELPIPKVETIPAMPYVEEKEEPAPVPVYVEPLAPVPAAPELPKFTMPELPLAENLPMPATPWIEDQAKPFVPIPAYRQPYLYNMVDYETIPKLPIQVVDKALPLPIVPYLDDNDDDRKSELTEPVASIPAAPELPLPEFPLRMDIPSTPIIIDPITLPQAPELPAFVMPELPKMEDISAALYLKDRPVPIEAVPEDTETLVNIPVAPELPPANLPEFPVRMEIPSPAIIEVPEAKAPVPMEIPLAPMLPEIKMSELAVRMEIEKPAPCEPSVVMSNPFYQTLFPSHISMYDEKEKKTQNILLPNFMESGAYPTPCIYNLVTKHILPNILSKNFVSMENKIKPASFLPCAHS